MRLIRQRFQEKLPVYCPFKSDGAAFDICISLACRSALSHSGCSPELTVSFSTRCSWFPICSWPIPSISNLHGWEFSIFFHFPSGSNSFCILTSWSTLSSLDSPIVIPLDVLDVLPLNILHCIWIEVLIVLHNSDTSFLMGSFCIVYNIALAVMVFLVPFAPL